MTSKITIYEKYQNEWIQAIKIMKLIYDSDLNLNIPKDSNRIILITQSINNKEKEFTN